MEILIFIGGVISGIIFTLIYKSKERIHGIIHVDHEIEQCMFSLTSNQLSDRKNKIAVFLINHDAKISRDEQSL